MADVGCGRRFFRSSLDPSGRQGRANGLPRPDHRGGETSTASSSRSPIRLLVGQACDKVQDHKAESFIRGRTAAVGRTRTLQRFRTSPIGLLATSPMDMLSGIVG
jgi:hypothetical protein